MQRVAHPTLPVLGQLLTTLLAEHEEELCGAVLHVRVDVGHEPHQLVPQRVPHLRPVPHVPQRRQHLRGHRQGDQWGWTRSGGDNARVGQLQGTMPRDMDKAPWVPGASTTTDQSPAEKGGLLGGWQ